MENTIKAPNFYKIINKKHINKWVALSLDSKRLVAVGDSLSDVLKKSGKNKITVMLVPPNIGYAPTTK